MEKGKSLLRFFEKAGMFFHTIKWKLFFFYICLSIIPTTVISFVLYSSAYQTIENKITVYSQQIMFQTVGKLDSMLSNVQDLSLQIATDRDIQSQLDAIKRNPDSAISQTYEKSIEKNLDNILSSRNEVVGADIIMAKTGNEIVSGENLIKPSSLKENAMYQKLANNHNATIWNGTMYNDNPQVLYPYVSTLVRKIKSVSTGEDLGVLILGVKEFAIADTFSYIDLGPTGFVFIVDQNGRVISHLEKNKLIKQAPYPFIDKIIHSSIDDPRTFSSVLDGKKVMVSYSVSQITGWFMVSVIPYDYLMEEIHMIGKISIRIGVVLLILAIWISFYISSSISKPVEKLVHAMNKVENGDLSFHLNLNSKNEIGKLGHHYNQMVKRIRELIKRVYESEIVKKEAEVKALQSQINPHFLYNTLAIIDSIASVKQEKEISEIAQILSDIFRYSTSGNDVTTLKEEINQIQRYLHIQKIRYKNKLTDSIQIEDNLENCLITKLLLQPIVENAVTHGINKSNRPGHIDIKAYLSDDETITIEIKDNGVGMSETQLLELKRSLAPSLKSGIMTGPQSITHIGIVNVQHRIKNYFGEEYGLFIESQPDQGTTITIVIPRLI